MDTERQFRVGWVRGSLGEQLDLSVLGLCSLRHGCAGAGEQDYKKRNAKTRASHC